MRTALLAAAKDKSDPPARRAVVRALAGHAIFIEGAAEALKDLSEDADAEVSRAAAEGLNRLTKFGRGASPVEETE